MDNQPTGPSAAPPILRTSAEALSAAAYLSRHWAGDGSSDADATPAALDGFLRSGLGAVMVPAAFGGPALPIDTAARIVSRLAAGDPGRARAAGAHLAQLAAAGSSPDADRCRPLFQAALAGRPLPAAGSGDGGAGASSVPSGRTELHSLIGQVFECAVALGSSEHAIETLISTLRDGAGARDEAADRALLREVAGLKVSLHAAEAVLAKAGKAIGTHLHEPTIPPSVLLIVSEARVLVGELALECGTKLCALTEPGRSDETLARQWREARRFATRHPRRVDVFAVGNNTTNGAPLQAATLAFSP